MYSPFIFSEITCSPPPNINAIQIGNNTSVFTSITYNCPQSEYFTTGHSNISISCTTQGVWRANINFSMVVEPEPDILLHLLDGCAGKIQYTVKERPLVLFL